MKQIALAAVVSFIALWAVWMIGRAYDNVVRVGCAVSLSTTVDANGRCHEARITEDDPRWDCRTMGNHVCGRRQ